MPSVPEVYSDITIVGGLLAKAGSCRFMGPSLEKHCKEHSENAY